MENLNSLEHKERLDVEMQKRGLVRSRSAAADLIKREKVSVNNVKALKPSLNVSPSDSISIADQERYVSRAGEKLAHALEVFKTKVDALTVLDIGSSTGGFTDCLLKNGASKVIALDVGTDQLVPELRDDPRVELHEGTNVRSFRLPSLVDAIVVDVSFISLTFVLPKAFEFLKKGGFMIALVKPQFEVGMETAKKYKGVITDSDLQNEVLESIKAAAKEIGFKVMEETASPFEGEKGNKEFLLLLKK